MSILSEFRQFALRGSVVDLAVGVIIGAAFGAIVASFVDDLIMPLFGAATGGLDFSNYYVPLSDTVDPNLALEDAKKLGAVFAYGKFITMVLKFVIVAWVLFLVIKAMNTMKRKQEAAPAPAETPVDIKLLTEIRDLLKNNPRT